MLANAMTEGTSPSVLFEPFPFTKSAEIPRLKRSAANFSNICEMPPALSTSWKLSIEQVNRGVR